MDVILILFSAVSFLGYGAACFLSPYLHREFDRYGFGSQRRLVGALQLAAALGLVAGFWLPWLGRLVALGLALMMLVAVGVRIRIRDTLPQTLPALVYLALNTYLAWTGF